MNSITQKFTSTSIMTTIARPDVIWKLWSDVNHWNQWDKGIQSTDLKGEFKEGNVFMMMLSEKQSFEILIKEMHYGTSFTDTAILPFGAVSTYHHIEPLGKFTKITHEMYIDVNSDSVDFFAHNIWQSMQQHLPISLKALLDLAQSIK